MKVEVDAEEVLGGMEISINVVGGRKTAVRMKLAMLVLRIAAWLLPVGVKIIIDGPEIKKRVRWSGERGQPPLAYDIGDSQFDPSIGAQLRVLLDGVEQQRVIAYDTEDRWIECWRSSRLEPVKRHGNVSVEWKK